MSKHQPWFPVVSKSLIPKSAATCPNACCCLTTTPPPLPHTHTQTPLVAFFFCPILFLFLGVSHAGITATMLQSFSFSRDTAGGRDMTVGGPACTVYFFTRGSITVCALPCRSNQDPTQIQFVRQKSQKSLQASGRHG